MRNHTTTFTVGALSLCLWGISFTASAPAAESQAQADASPTKPRGQLLTFDDLQRRLNDPNLRILDCRPRADYEKGHLPGALWVDTKALETRAAQPGGLTDRTFWENWAGTLGLTAQSAVVTYDARKQLDAARVWFFLRWMGVENAALVNGGFPLWAKEQRPVTTDVPQIPTRPWKVEFQKDVGAAREDVLAALKDRSAKVLDNRTAAEVSGTDRKSKRGGHIPAACHLEWTQLVDDDGRFLNRQDLLGKFEKAGIRTGEQVICHCQGGGRAAVSTFALEWLGCRARNYYLGWSDWGNAEGTPIVEGAIATPQDAPER
ncbi:MAG: sulfurtransferase [Planctomycetes bacterium]|nr:sulfurtransferase [Planctomycetota bacterium]